MAYYGLQINQPYTYKRKQWLYPNKMQRLKKWADDDCDAEIALRRELMGLPPELAGTYD